jgi:hypothetical protein
MLFAQIFKMIESSTERMKYPQVRIEHRRSAAVDRDVIRLRPFTEV